MLCLRWKEGRPVVRKQVEVKASKGSKIDPFIRQIKYISYLCLWKRPDPFLTGVNSEKNRTVKMKEHLETLRPDIDG